MKEQNKKDLDGEKSINHLIRYKNISRITKVNKSKAIQCNGPLHLFYFLFFYFILFTHERHREAEGEAGPLRSREPNAGLNPRGSWDHNPIRRQRLNQPSHLGAQSFFFFLSLYLFI